MAFFFFCSFLLVGFAALIVSSPTGVIAVVLMEMWYSFTSPSSSFLSRITHPSFFFPSGPDADEWDVVSLFPDTEIDCIEH